MNGNSYMAQALAEAQAAAARGEVPVGAVLVDGRSGEVLAAAGNRTEADSDPTAHAEMLAIRQAARLRGTPRLTGCDLYVTLEPWAYDPKGGGVEHGPRIFSQPSCFHAPESYGGIGETDAAALLKDFFAARRRAGGSG